jgi:hypothetical protein
MDSKSTTTPQYNGVARYCTLIAAENITYAVVSTLVLLCKELI